MTPYAAVTPRRARLLPLNFAANARCRFASPRQPAAASPRRKCWPPQHTLTAVRRARYRLGAPALHLSLCARTWPHATLDYSVASSPPQIAPFVWSPRRHAAPAGRRLRRSFAAARRCTSRSTAAARTHRRSMGRTNKINSAI